MKIPFYNLSKDTQKHKNELLQSISETIDSGSFILGQRTEAFESDFADYIGTAHCVGVNSGLDALTFALQACGIGPGDEVIVPAHTFIATWLAVSNVQAKIIPVEPDETYNISTNGIIDRLTAKTKAIIIVHLYGRPFDVQHLKKKLNGHACHIIEDAAQAHGSSINGQMCGSIGDLGAFSFYPTKSLGAFGDGGAIVTNNQQHKSTVRSLRNYGSTVKYHHEDIGYNSRLDEIQAGILSIKLNYLDEANEKKRKIANMYQNGISNSKLVKPLTASTNSEIAWHQYVLRTNQREDFIKHMKTYGIGSMIHYPIPPHLSQAYAHLSKPFKLELTEQYSESVVSIPIYSTLKERETSYIVDVINAF